MSFVKGQPKIGGRKKGSLNKTTVARAVGMEEAERRAGRRLAVERMAEAMEYWFNIAGKHQPGRKEMKDGKEVEIPVDHEKFVQAMKEGARLAEALAPYQTPKLQSTTLRHDAPPEPIRITVEFV